MTSRMTGNSIFASAINSIKSSYYYFLQDASGLTLDNLINPPKELKTNSYMNYNFSSYLTSNFSKFDLDGDGKISEKELNEYTTRMTTYGLTYNELVQLCAQNGSSSLLETVLNNFQDIDTNGDGRVTSGEISAYTIDQEKEEMEKEYPKVDPNHMSVFYDTSSSSHDDVKKVSKS